MKQRIDILDSFRGMAAMIVLFHHVYSRFRLLFPSESTFTGRLLTFISDFNVEAVLFFFLISGFSIALSVSGEWKYSTAGINQYLYRRFRRIIPLYLLALALTALCGMLTGSIDVNHDYGFSNLAGNLFFLQCSNAFQGNWFSPYGGNGPLWTLSFEMWFYLFLPLIMLFAAWFSKRVLTRWHPIYIGFLTAWIFSMVSIWINRQLFIPWVAFGTHFVIWYLGFWMGMIHVNGKSNKKIFLILLVFASFHFYLVAWVSSVNIQKISTAGIMACVIMLLSNVPEGLKAKARKLEKIINLIFNRTGYSSYALYLFHYPLLQLCFRYFPNAVTPLLLTLLFIWLLSFTAENWLKNKKLLFFKRNYMSSLHS